MAKKTTKVDKPMTRTEILSELAEQTDLSKKDVGRVLDGLSDIIHAHVKKRSAGMFTLPGLLKIKVVATPARKAKKNVPNPFKPGEMMEVSAKPARNVVKIRPLKNLKDMVA